ncbi:AAA family ATPase [Streptomyces sp. NPDC001292]|uniref:helix-turn-helix transcriptional regulator n=1 Tax=Streptomyces sp. NPDC001292 TaxID=3364558 RepID=UPI0036B498B7
MSGSGPWSGRSQIVGRIEDVQRVWDFLDDASGRGRGLHIVGEAGVGKTTLLDAVAEVATEAGMRVLRAAGVEFEADVPFAGLHQVLSPLLDDIEQLRPEYRTALEVTLGFCSGETPDRLVLVNAIMALLREGSAEAPLLLIVDDLPWLDRASAVALGFVSRRLAGSRVCFLGASRTGSECVFDHGGLDEFELAPLDDDSAHLLLAAKYPRIAARVRARVVAEARGNPLALLELPTELTGAQQSATQDLPNVLPLSERLRALFVARINALPVAGRHVLLLAALDGTGDPTVLRRAAGADPSALTALGAAERERLVLIDPVDRRLTFRHPLIRAAAVAASTLGERHAAHVALAEALKDQPERTAWHLAEAAMQPDEKVAGLLQEAGHSALRRGDAVRAVAALTRAADLSPAAPDRARRLAQAAYIGAESTGDVTNASALLHQMQGDNSLGDGALYAAAAAVYVLTNTDADLGVAYRLLTAAIEEAGPEYDADDAALIDALHTLQLLCWWIGREELWQPFIDTVDKLRPAPPPVLALSALAFPDPARTGVAALAVLDEARSVLRGTVDHTLVVRGATGSVYLDRVGELRDRLWEVVRSSREGGGTVRRHIAALMHLCMEDYLTGAWDEAQQLVDEGRLLSEAGYPFFTWYLEFVQALLHGVRGETEAGEALAERMLRWSTRRGVGAAAVLAHQARTVVCLGRGDYEAAYRHATALTPAGALAPYTAHALWGVYDLVEAAVRTGRADQASAHLRAMSELGIGRLSDRYAMLVEGAAGLCAADDEAIDRFRRALAVPGAEHWAFDSARIRLALGERLRRTNEKNSAREQLTAALQVFSRLGAQPWAERARRELRAAGQPTRRADRTRLTSQELEISRLAASGLTNKQIGERLFLSPRTVSAHLYQVFPKLGITSRASLRDALNTLEELNALEEKPEPLR